MHIAITPTALPINIPATNKIIFFMSPVSPYFNYCVRVSGILPDKLL